MPYVYYTPREYADMHFIYGECHGSAERAAALYRERYPFRRHPNPRVFIATHNSYCEGKIPGNCGGEGRPRTSDDDIILEEVNRDSFTSVRIIEHNTGISKSTVHRVLQRYGMHPYHVQRVQALLPQDYEPIVFF